MDEDEIQYGILHDSGKKDTLSILMPDAQAPLEKKQRSNDFESVAGERTLVQQAKQDPEAFGKLYQAYVKRIYNYHYRHTGNSNEAEDLTSRTFFRALRNIPYYKDRGVPFQAWLFRIAHNLVVNWYRDQSRHPTFSLEVAHSGLHAHRGDPQLNLLESEKQELLTRLIDGLPEVRKTLLLLKFVEQMSNAEIGEVLGKSEGAVKSLYHRTLLDLRQSIQEGEFDGLI
ncbi:MAG: RNA polymerase sigma factor [Anaerolineae bacterium]|nr:RNA polymerase sigma factor [Anaerolineae bacterium]